MSLNSNSIEISNKKGNILNEQGKFSEAIECFDQSIQLDSNQFETLRDKGYAFYCLKNFDNAIESYEDACRTATNNDLKAELNYRIGLIHNETSEFPTAIYYFNKAIELNSKIFDFHFHKAESLKNSKFYREALNSFYTALHLNPDCNEAKKKIAILNQKIQCEMRTSNECKRFKAEPT